MARTTIDDVRNILEATDLTDPVITSYITSANVMVTGVLSNSGVGVDLLQEIERWLTGHMIVSTRERQSKEEEAGGASIEYTGKYGESLASTSYGQMVITLDPTGQMAAVGMKRASLEVISQDKDV